MKKILIRTVGKPQADWQKEAIDEYLQRLKPFAHVEIEEMKEGQKGTAKPDLEITLRNEAESLLSNLPPQARLICLDETGPSLTSEKFAELVEQQTFQGDTLVFFIGGSWGLHPTVKARATQTLSFGKQTFPHILARIVLLEQLYRAMTILNGKTYHK